MNLWHDKSYIAPSGPEWVERGYAIQRLSEMRRLRQGDVPDRFKRHLCLLPVRNI